MHHRPPILKIQLLLSLMTLIIGLVPGMHAQPQSSAAMVDILVFRSAPGEPKARVDVYVAVPNDFLQFEKVGAKYASKFKIHITARDSASRIVLDTMLSKTAFEVDYATSRGSSGKSANSVVQKPLSPGKYRFEVHIADELSRRETSLAKALVVPDMVNAIPGMSSIMLVSEVEERGDRFRISPYIGSTVWSNEQSMFAFLEVYTDRIGTTYKLNWDIVNADAVQLAAGEGNPFTTKAQTTQTFIPIRVQSQHPAPGSYTLRVSLHEISSDMPDSSRALSTQTHEYIIPRSAMGNVMSDLNKAIRQLAYIGDQQDIDYIMNDTNERSRQERFEEFWKKHDPTPNTVKNEAFEDFYSRVERANRKYKSYVEGWQSDMGRVSIIFGEPMSIDRSSSATTSTQLVRWNYSNGTYYIFEDATGFGDFRLRSAISPGAKYNYRRSGN